MAEPFVLSPETWRRLRERTPLTDDAVEVVLLTPAGSSPPIEAGIDAAGRLHLLLPLSSELDTDLPPDLNGVRVRVRESTAGRKLLVSAPPSHERVFTPFCHEVIRAVFIEKREPLAATAALIRQWRSALNPLPTDFSASVQVGLVGELHVLTTVLVPTIGPRAVDLWSGPESDRHDFVGDATHVEVKATRGAELRFWISRHEQLRRPPGKRLLVAAVRVHQSPGCTETVADFVDRALESLDGDGVAIDLLFSKLFALGWNEGLRRSGNLIRLSIDTLDFFVVDSAFPRLPDDFQPPSGVLRIQYEIALANLSGMAENEVLEAVRQM